MAAPVLIMPNLQKSFIYIVMQVAKDWDVCLCKKTRHRLIVSSVAET
jgi:hypothetical protein